MQETFNDVAQRGRRSDSLQKQEIEAMPPSFGQAVCVPSYWFRSLGIPPNRPPSLYDPDTRPVKSSGEPLRW
jgi:hypothetical protein